MEITAEHTSQTTNKLVGMFHNSIGSLLLLVSINLFFKYETNAQIRTHTRANTPQNDRDFGIYAARVALFKQFLEVELPRVDKKGLFHGVPLNTYDYHKWTEQDLRVLATSFNSEAQFETLTFMKNSAVVKDQNGRYTREAIQAQNALAELKPDCCKNWKSFFNMIIRVERETEAERAAIKARR